MSGGFAEGVTRSLEYEPFEDSDLTGDYDYMSDSDLEDDDQAAGSATEVHDPMVGDQNLNVTVGGHDELAHQGKVVTLQGVSYLTSVRTTIPWLYLLIDSLVASRPS